MEFPIVYKPAILIDNLSQNNYQTASILCNIEIDEDRCHLESHMVETTKDDPDDIDGLFVAIEDYESLLEKYNALVNKGV